MTTHNSQVGSAPCHAPLPFSPGNPPSVQLIQRPTSSTTGFSSLKTEQGYGRVGMPPSTLRSCYQQLPCRRRKKTQDFSGTQSPPRRHLTLRIRLKTPPATDASALHGAGYLCLIKGWFMFPRGVFISMPLFHP